MRPWERLSSGSELRIINWDGVCGLFSTEDIHATVLDNLIQSTLAMNNTQIKSSRSFQVGRARADSSGGQNAVTR